MASLFHDSVVLNYLPNVKILAPSKLQAFAEDKSKVAEIAEYKTLREKEKMPITSIFFFFHDVFKRLLFQGHENLRLFGFYGDMFM